MEMISRDEQNELLELLKIFWEKKIIIGCIVLTSIIIAVLFSISLPNQYKSSILVTPASKESNSLSGLTSQLGGLASIAGVNLGANQDNKSQIALELMKSQSVIKEFDKLYNLKSTIMATTGWDSANNKLIYDTALYDAALKEWVAEDGISLEPTDFDLYQYFTKNTLSISKDSETGFITITVEHYSPYVAKELVEKLLAYINQRIKASEIDEGNERISYLTSAVNKTELFQMKGVFYQLIEQQEQNKMLAMTTKEFALKTIDPAVLAEKKSSPKRVLICLLGVILGIFVALLYAIFLMVYRRVSIGIKNVN